MLRVSIRLTSLITSTSLSAFLSVTFLVSTLWLRTNLYHLQHPFCIHMCILCISRIYEIHSLIFIRGSTTSIRIRWTNVSYKILFVGLHDSLWIQINSYNFIYFMYLGLKNFTYINLDKRITYLVRPRNPAAFSFHPC